MQDSSGTEHSVFAESLTSRHRGAILHWFFCEDPFALQNIKIFENMSIVNRLVEDLKTVQTDNPCS